MANVPYTHAGRERSLHRGPLPGVLRSPASRPPPRPVSSSLVSSHRPLVAGGGLLGGAGGGLIGGPGGAAAGVGGDPYDFGADPILQKIQAIATMERQNALASALAARKQLAIQYGDTAGILEGDQFDQSTADAAHNNPFSILHELQTSYERGTHNIDENTNRQNLFYSGEHARQLGLAAEDLQRQRYGAGQKVLGQVGGIQSALAQALMGADERDAQAQADAAARAQQQALQYGYNPGGSSSSGLGTNARPSLAAASGDFAPGNTTLARHFAGGESYTPPVAPPPGAAPSSIAPASLLAAIRAIGRGRPGQSPIPRALGY